MIRTGIPLVSFAFNHLEVTVWTTCYIELLVRICVGERFRIAQTHILINMIDARYP